MLKKNMAPFCSTLKIKTIVKYSAWLNEQTYSLQVSDSVSLWAYWVWQTVHSIPVRKAELRMVTVLRGGLQYSCDNGSIDSLNKCGQTQHPAAAVTEDRLPKIWCRLWTSPSQISMFPVIWQVSQEVDPDILCVPQPEWDERCCGAALQFNPYSQTIDAKRRLCCKCWTEISFPNLKANLVLCHANVQILMYKQKL